MIVNSTNGTKRSIFSLKAISIGVTTFFTKTADNVGHDIFIIFRSETVYLRVRGVSVGANV